MKTVLKLYVSGQSAKSLRAINNFNRIAHEAFNDQCEIEIIDIQNEPQLAIESRIVAIPTLVKSHPPPVHKMIGDLTDTETVLLGLGLKPGEDVTSVKELRIKEMNHE